MKTILLVSGFTLSFLWSASQKEASNWVFGYNTYLSWNTGAPAPVASAVMNQNEGVASISDTSGQLLFYTDGVTVRNRFHQPMPNGLHLKGNYSSTQSALIVPRPLSNQYYIFTTDADGGANGLCYSIVDMSLDGGRGAVTAKNVLLFTPACEKLTAVRHANGRDVWVVSHQWNSSAFYSYLVTSSGIQPVPVVTNVGHVHTYMGGSSTPAYGYMKASPDGKKLAVAVWGIGGWLDILDFDNRTGIPSHPVTDRAFTEQGPYGLEFSPDSRRLYASEMNYMDSSRLFQYDIQAGASGVLASRLVIATGMTYDHCGMQLAADGKIYITSYPNRWLHVIRQPDAIGAFCGYTSKGVTWSGAGYAQLGLPNYITSYFHRDERLDVTITTDKAPCDSACGGKAEVMATGGTPPYQFNWLSLNKTGANVSGLCAGNYTVEVSDAAGRKMLLPFSIHQATPAPVEIHTGTRAICATDTALICSTPGFISYQWNTGETTHCIRSHQAGNYQVTATDRYGCTAASDRLNLTVIPPPVISISVEGNKIYTMMPTNYQWYLNGVLITGANSSELVAMEPGLYWLEVRDTNGCVAKSTSVHITSSKELNEETGIHIYPNPSITGNIFISADVNLAGRKVELFNMSGQMVFQTHIRHPQSEIHLPLPKGTYLLRMETEKGLLMRRITLM